MTDRNCNRDELINLLKSFISFKSVQHEPNQKTECLDWVHGAFLADAGQKVQRGEFEGSPWLYLPAGDCRLLVFAHVDVVPAPDDMFTLTVDGDKAMGRGTSDMKGNILPFLMAYRDTIKEGTQSPIGILITTDEEIAGATIPHLLSENIVTAPAAFTPDSNDLGIVCEHKGGIWARLTAHGKGGHGAYPWDTENPIWLLCKALESIQQAFPTGGHDDWHITVTPTKLEGSTAQNQVPKQAACGLDIRFTPQQHATSEEALQAVRSILPDGCTLEESLSVAPLHTDANHPIIAQYTKIASDILGRDVPCKREHGGTDARYFSEKGIPAFLFGPEGGGLHSDSEWVSVDSLMQHYRIYREWFENL